MSGKVGKDSDYAGGEALRSVDKKLQSWGLSRDSPLIRCGHAIEHMRRGVIAEWQGDVARAQAEYARAKQNGSRGNSPVRK